MEAAPVLLLGLILLVVGAELVVRYGARLARQIGVPPIVIGLVVVSLGTSAPELAVAVEAARSGTVPLAVGNLAGANLANLLLLGIIAAFGTIHIDRRTRRLELPALAIATLVLWLLTLDGRLHPLDGVVLLIVAFAYLVQLVHPTRRRGAAINAVDEEPDSESRHVGLRRTAAYVATVVAGIVAIVCGADWLVHAAIDIAGELGVSDTVIGLTVVAFGTTVPELATTIVALVRHEPDIGLGNLIGSSIFNITLVLGFALLFVPGVAPLDSQLTTRYIPLLLAGTVGCVVLALTRQRLSRVEGIILILGYLACLSFVILVSG